MLLDLCSSSESASFLRQYEAISFNQLNSESKAVTHSASVIKKTDIARPIFHAILDEYERWLYSSPSDLNLARYRDSDTSLARNSRIKPLSSLPPSISRRKQSGNQWKSTPTSR